MSDTVLTPWRTLFPGESAPKLALRRFAARALVHRMLKFGYEPQINLYSAAELRGIAMFLPVHQAGVLLAEADRKDAA